MKPLLAVALCATTIALGAPAVAQPYERGPAAAVQPGHALREQLDALDRRIQEGIRAGQIDRGEADRATREVVSIREEQDRMRARNGGELSEIDRGRLQERLDSLGRSIHWMREHGPVGGPPGVGAPPPIPPGVGDWPLERREAWLQQRISDARADRSLSRREAYQAQMMLNDIRASQARMLRRGGGRLRESDRAYLEERLSQLRERLRGARRDDAPPWGR